jgi:hypothetical protein
MQSVTTMQQLTGFEIEEVSGGNPIVVGIATGLAASYAYESIGGAQGVRNAYSAVAKFSERLQVGIYEFWAP